MRVAVLNNGSKIRVWYWILFGTPWNIIKIREGVTRGITVKGGCVGRYFVLTCSRCWCTLEKVACRAGNWWQYAMDQMPTSCWKRILFCKMTWISSFCAQDDWTHIHKWLQCWTAWQSSQTLLDGLLEQRKLLMRWSYKASRCPKWCSSTCIWTLP